MITAISGGTGFIGRRLVLYHLAQGDEVRVLTRSLPEKSILPCEVRLWQGDLTKNGDFKSFLSGADVFYHCAGELRDAQRMHAVHVSGAKNLCAAARGNIGHWVQLSSVGAYGFPHEGIIKEKAEIRPRGTFEITNTMADQLIIEVSRKGGFSFSVLRPSIVYGPDMPNQSLFQMISMISKRLFFFIGKPGASANYIHVDNVVCALTLCATAVKAKGDIFNLSGYMTLEGLVHVLADELRCQAPRLRLPEQPVRWVSRLLDKVPFSPLTSSRVGALTNRRRYPIDHIEESLGYAHSITMEEGMRQLVRAWRRRDAAH